MSYTYARRPLQIFRPVAINDPDALLQPIMKVIPHLPNLGRRLRQRDVDNPDGGIHPDGVDSLFGISVGGVHSIEMNEDILGVALRVPRLVSVEPVWFQVRGGDARDLFNRFSFGTIVGFGTRFPIMADGSTPTFDACKARGYFIPHAIVYVP